MRIVLMTKLGILLQSIKTIDPQPLEGNQAYEIFPDYPELYEVMHLPTDYIILFKGHEIVSVLNTDSVDVWN